MTLQCTRCYMYLHMSHGLMSCSMDRSKMHVQRRHLVRENVCTIIIREHYCFFFDMNNSVCFVCHVSVHMCESVCVSVYLCVCVCMCVCVYCVCICECMSVVSVHVCLYVFCVCVSLRVCVFLCVCMSCVCGYVCISCVCVCVCVCFHVCL